MKCFELFSPQFNRGFLMGWSPVGFIIGDILLGFQKWSTNFKEMTDNGRLRWRCYYP